MRVAIRPNDARQRSAGGWMVAHALFDEGLEVRELEGEGVGDYGC